MPRTKKTTSDQGSELNFEQALGELESMVETMESGQLPLEDLISNYERGAELIKHCETVLGNARKRLELLTLSPTAQKSAQPAQDSAPTNNDESNHGDDEIRLF